LGKYVYSSGVGKLGVHQYISSELQNGVIELQDGSEITISLEMNSGFPYDGKVQMKVSELTTSRGSMTVPLNIVLRRPSWTTRMIVTVNGIPETSQIAGPIAPGDAASGFDPRIASFHTLHRNWAAGDEIILEFEMPVLTRRAHPKVKGHQGKAAITRGPLVYCLESVDNAGIDIFSVRVDLYSLQTVTAHQKTERS
jgi:DUF1680 family protein